MGDVVPDDKLRQFKFVISERNLTVIAFTNMRKGAGNCVLCTERSTVVAIWHHSVRICAI